MNEKPEGTPNPLNPFDANPSEPVEEIEAIQINETESIPLDTEARPEVKPVDTVSEMTEEKVFIESLDPEGRTMEQAKEPVAPKKKKTGLIVGLIVSLFVAVGCGVAAVLMLLQGPKDPVSVAMKKIMSGDMPSNVIIDGDIEFSSTNPNSNLSRINIELNSNANTSSLLNSSTAEVVLTMNSGEELSFQFDEVYAESGDLYFKLDGASTMLQNINLFELFTVSNGSKQTNCITDESGETNCVEPIVLDCEIEDGCEPELIEEVVVEEIVEEAPIDQSELSEIQSMLANVISIIDGEWIKVSMDELSELSGGVALESDLSCMVNLVDSINTNSNSSAELYNKYPFLSSTTEDVTIVNKLNPVNRVLIDSTAFANFINGIKNSNLTEDFYNCIGADNNVEVTSEDIEEIINEFPPIYVEVDKDNNFSRLYLESEIEDSEMEVKIDLSFTYPKNINVSEPVEYSNFSDKIQEIFMSIYEIEDTTTPTE